MLQSPRLKDHVHNIGIEKSLRKNSLYEHRCLKIIKKLYKQAGKCDDQQQFKDILEADVVYTIERLTYDSLITPMT